MTSQIRHLATPQAEYAAGDYLLLTFGNGTHVARIELASAKRYRIRRLQARGTDRANWEVLTSWISKTDARILGRLGLPDAIRLAPHCPPVADWIETVRELVVADRESTSAKMREADALRAAGASIDHIAEFPIQSPESRAARNLQAAEASALSYMKHADRLVEELEILGRPGAIARAAAAVPGVELKAEPVVQAEPVEDAAIAELEAETAHQLAELETFTPDEIDAVFGPGPFPASPTRTQYGELDLAYEHFNRELFGGELPHCLLTMNRKAKAHGYFTNDRFQNREGSIVTHEISLNADSLRDRDDRANLATLAHEMVHLWQREFGEPPRKAYHDKEWAGKMREIGLIPTDTGYPGGKETGGSVTHYIEEGGRFALSYERLIGSGWTMPFIHTPGDEARAKKQRASKTKFQCPCCDQAAWGKPTLKILCSDCDELMVAQGEPVSAEEA